MLEQSVVLTCERDAYSVPRKRLARVRGLGPYRAKLSAGRAGPCPCGGKEWKQREGVWEERQGFDGVGGGHTDSVAGEVAGHFNSEAGRA